MGPTCSESSLLGKGRVKLCRGAVGLGLVFGLGLSVLRSAGGIFDGLSGGLVSVVDAKAVSGHVTGDPEGAAEASQGSPVMLDIENLVFSVRTSVQDQGFGEREKGSSDR